MIKLLTIIGARPQIIKAAAISRAIRTKFADQVQEKILHTGQHYDENMSGVFFNELGIPEPDYNLHVGSGKHGEQTAKMIAGIEQVLLSEHFDGVIVYGDTNSTLAAAVAAGKLHIPIYHVEAGLRSFNMAMPEEQNRIVCDHLSTILFAPTQTAVDNLVREGMPDKNHRVVLSGDVMYDNALYFAEMAEKKTASLNDRCAEGPLSLKDRCANEALAAEGKFVLATIHRDNNTDDPKRLEAIIRAILTLADEGHEIVLPLHPRTRKLLPENLPNEIYNKLINHAKIHILPPASFFDILMLEKYAQVVMTDSGGVQKEAGAGILADADYERIVNAYHELSGKKVQFPKLFGDGHAAERIVEEIVD